MKKNLIILFLLTALTASLTAQKTAILWYLPTMSEFQALSIAKHDLAILDLENIFNNNEQIDLIIAKNPDIKLLIYWNLVEWFDPMFSDKPWSIKVLAELKERPEYWLKQSDGRPVYFWPGMKMINITEKCPIVKGQNYREFILERLWPILEDKRFSGIVYDNAWTNIDWLARFNGNQDIDADLNGKADDPQVLNSAYQREVRRFIKEVGDRMGKKFIMIANPGNLSYLDILDGKIFENFPDRTLGDRHNDSWDINMAYAKNGKSYNIINARPDNLFFSLCSAMLLDEAYIAWKQNEPWHDFYHLDLGKAIDEGKEIRPNVYQRNFENGLVEVDAENSCSEIRYKNGKLIRSKDIDGK